MVWKVYGDASFSFSVTEHGLSISGDGRHACLPAASTGVDTGALDLLPALWTIYRASESAGVVDLLGWDVSTGTHNLDPAVVKDSARPVGVIRYYDQVDLSNPAHIGFSAFLPVSGHADLIIDYTTVRHGNEPISTATTESTVQWLLRRRMDANQQMRLSPRGAHLMLKIRTSVVNDPLDTVLCQHPL